MTRRMTITVVNTGIEEQWNRSADHLEHGKWMDGSPPSTVNKNSTAIVKSEKTTGSAYGTTGWISFISATNPGSTMTITWNKPYGHDATTCTVDMNSVTYKAEVKNKNFQESEAWCDVVISVNPESVIDTKNWMGKLADSTKLNGIMMPGSHDAGMSIVTNCTVGAGDSNTQTQQLDIKGQLEAGSRYFDIRVDYDHDNLTTYHRFLDEVGCNGQLLEPILDQATEFLRGQPSETILLKFSHIRSAPFHDSDTIKELIDEMLNQAKYSNYIYKADNANLASTEINHCRGKMIILMDYSYNISPTSGRFRYNDGFVEDDKYSVCEYRGLNMTVCDRYANTASYGEMSDFEINKWRQYGGFGKDYLFLLSWTLTAGTTGPSIRDLAKVANDNLPSVLKDQIENNGLGKPNIVYIDFVNVTTTRAIIQYNF